jgi:hypothetical protein
VFQIVNIADDIVQHIDIKEEGKENAFSLGSSLWIGGEVSYYPILWLMKVYKICG